MHTLTPPSGKEQAGRSMHILYLHQYFCPPGGNGNTRSQDFARMWAAEGHQVTVLTSIAQFPHQRMEGKAQGEILEEYWEGVRIIALPVAYSHFWSFRKRILAFIQFYRNAKHWLNTKGVKESFDIIYASSTPPTVAELGNRWSQKRSIPWVFETVDVWPDVPIGMGIIKNKWLSKWLIKRVDRLYEQANHIVCLSEGMAAQVLSHGDWGHKTTIVHNGADLSQFPPSVHRGESETMQVVYAGTIGVANGLDHLIRACKYLKEKGESRIQVNIIGNGNDAARIKAMAAELAWPFLQFHDLLPKEDVPGLLAQADCGVVCFANFSVLEANSANKLFDYLAAGLPVVLNYEGWQAAYIKKAQCGLCVPQGDDKGLAEALIQLAQMSPKGRKEMGERGRALASEHFDRNKLALKLLSLFEKIKAS